MTVSAGDRDESVLLGVLLDDHPAHIASGELARELSWPHDRIEDALAALARAGLIHRYGDFAFASRAARQCWELDV